MTRRQKVFAFLGWVLAGLLLIAPSVSAQGWSLTGWFQHTIATQRAELADIIDAHATYGVDADVRAYIDDAYVWRQQVAPWGTLIHIEGWAFERGEYVVKRATVDVASGSQVFATDVTALVNAARYPRPDLPLDPGLHWWALGAGKDVTPFGGVSINVPADFVTNYTYDVTLRVMSFDGHLSESNRVSVRLQ